MTRPVTPSVPESVPGQGWFISFARAINLLMNGKMNAVTSVTLTANAVTTTLVDSRIGMYSHVTLEPATASAATARTGLYVVPGSGQAVITHANTADLDKEFSALIIG